MRVGIMLRSLREKGGIGVYTSNIVPRMIRGWERHEFALFYRDAADIGTYASLPNVDERIITTPTKLLWDQWGARRLASELQCDVLFNPKFSVPLLSSLKSVMVLHGSAWFRYPEFFSRADIAYIKAAMPQYCREADHLIANSDCTKDDFVNLLGVPSDKITTIHLAPADNFRPVRDEGRIERVLKQYGLPDEYILSVTTYSPRKNVPTLIRSFLDLPKESRPPLVLVGTGVDRFLENMEDDGLDVSDIICPGWVDQCDLPAIYSAATLLGFPSWYECFGIPVLEAMACGCPVVAADTGAIPEITDGAASLVSPDDPRALTEALEALLDDGEERRKLRQRGLSRAKAFSWEKSASRTLGVLERVHDGAC